ncbi:MAG: U32 family peptidase [Phycisphaerae bacterium]|nr:U32 family peptidase [Phycisphaerae bacterium]
MNVDKNNADTKTSRGPELLAPAGNWAMMRAAVANGADAVYFGLEDFNARRRAENFSLDRLDEVMAFLRDHNVRGYVAFNTLIFPGELSRAEAFVAGIARAGADAVIVQDVGVMRLIRQTAPTLPIHASTQATQTHPAGLSLLSSLGVSRVILARELTVAQIAACRAAGLEVETFVHGALCVSYSGQCLASAYLWGRSANRGQCGQACRLPYQVCSSSTGVPPVSRMGVSPMQGQPVDEISVARQDRHGRDARGTHGQDARATASEGESAAHYPISPLDLNAAASLPALTRAGVCAFKIEGRLKGPHYVAAVVQWYRAVIDAAAAGRPFEPTAQHRRQLAATFSRGFTDGFLRSESAAVVAGDRSARRGAFVGVVVDFDYDGVVVELASECELAPIKPGDGLAFGENDTLQGGRVYDVKPWRMSPEFLRRSRRAAAPGHAATASSVGRVEFVRLGFGRGDLDLKKIRFGDSVWKTDDPAVQKALEASWARDTVPRPAAVEFTVTAAVGGPLTLHARSGELAAHADWPGPCERAAKHPLTAEVAASQLARLGDTPFALGGVTLRASQDAAAESSLPVLAPRSVLNELRRQVVESLQAQRHEAARHAVADEHALRTLRAATVEIPQPLRSETQASPCTLHVLVRSADALEAVLAWPGASAVGDMYLDADDLSTMHALAERCRRAGREIAVATPRILKPGEEAAVDGLLELQPRTWLVRNLATLSLLRTKTAATMVGDYGLNAANDLTVDWLLQAGFERVTPSYDLSCLHVEELVRAATPSRLEIVAHQHMPMLHMQHDPRRGLALRSSESEAGDAAAFLEDRNDQQHPIRRDVLGRTTVFGSYAQTAMPYAPTLRAAGVEHFRVELLDEPPQQIHATLDLYNDVLAGLANVADAWPKLKALGPVTRGTWTGESVKSRDERD